jgi:hypothetical protein
LSHGHFYAISPVIHNDSFEKLDFNINLHGDYKSYENLEFFGNYELPWLGTGISKEMVGWIRF